MSTQQTDARCQYSETNLVIPRAMCQGGGVRRILKGAGSGSCTDSTSAAFLPPEASQKCEIAVDLC
jgi:hypothetical protein